MAKPEPIRHVVLDWNGTLLDDLDLAVDSVNLVCQRYGVAPVTRAAYRAGFRFPVAAFYASIGFDLEQVDFGELVGHYLAAFDAGLPACPLHPGCQELLEEVARHGATLSILSASYLPTLRDTIRIKRLAPYFRHVRGLQDCHAVSKLAEAHALQVQLDDTPASVLYVGDTDHDAEIGVAMGWVSWTVACGHQDEARLAPQAPRLVRDLHSLREELPALLAGSHTTSAPARQSAPGVCP